MRKLLIVVTLLLSCSEQRQTAPIIELKAIPLLQDCVLVSFDPGGSAPYMNVVRCPGSVTTTHYNCGKGCVHDDVVEASTQTPKQTPKKIVCSHSSGATYTCQEQP